ncbi:MAG: M43 family zinc metalloprotease, partial [Bacteroidota bacterium]|nr:M43 family zinc metalloprotease [Bacteroidota bacterium]
MTLLFRTTLMSFLVIIFFNSASAQERCKSGIIHNQLKLSDPAYALKVQQNEAVIQNILSNPMRTSGIYTIPVVVHVLHLGEAVGTGTNISTAQIMSAINNMNDCYSGSAGYPLDIEVQFQLAQRDPDCNSTSGINRINASGTSTYGTQGITTANEEIVKALSKWPNAEYYNIWIVSEIDNNGGGSGTQGYAYFPGAGSDVDGAVILFNSFGYDPTGTIGYNLKAFTRHNSTANHELGHGFNLYHTFEGDDGNSDGNPDQCPVNTTCSTDGDLCCDTEAHRRDDGDCGATGSTCTGQSIVTIVENIMAYSSDVCQVRFSADQKTRMRAAILGARGTLLTSPGLMPVTGSTPSVAKTCSPNSTELSNNFGMGVFGLTIGSTSYSSSGTVADGGFRDNWCSNFSLTPSTLYSIQVDNATVNDEKVKVYIDYNNDGDFSDSGENIFNGNTGGASHSG